MREFISSEHAEPLPAHLDRLVAAEPPPVARAEPIRTDQVEEALQQESCCLHWGSGSAWQTEPEPKQNL